MIHETNISLQDARTGPVYLRFGTVDGRTTSDGSPVLALGIELAEELVLTPVRTVLIMSQAEAIRLSDELRRLASDTQQKARRIL